MSFRISSSVGERRAGPPETISFDPATECEEARADSLVELLHGVLQKKHLIEALNPDVILLQEVAKKDVAASDHPFAAWSGSNPHKGLGVLGVTKARYKVTEAADPSLPWHIPFSVDGLNIIALWAHQHTKDLRYVRVTHEIVDRHADFLSEGSALLMGDFNSNTIWDKVHPGRNHTMLVEKLNGLGLSSVSSRTACVSYEPRIGKPRKGGLMSGLLRGCGCAGFVSGDGLQFYSERENRSAAAPTRWALDQQDLLGLKTVADKPALALRADTEQACQRRRPSSVMGGLAGRLRPVWR